MDFNDFSITFQFDGGEPFLVNQQKVTFVIPEDNLGAYEIKAVKDFESKKVTGPMVLFLTVRTETFPNFYFDSKGPKIDLTS